MDVSSNTCCPRHKAFISWLAMAVILLLLGIGGNQANAQFAGGSGTAADPYQIADVAQLQAIHTSNSAHYILINNIDASATAGWNGGQGFNPINNFSAIQLKNNIVEN